jgi:SNF2 family DNA or RNA helicase
MKFLLNHAAAALFLDPGLGKTSITLGAIKVLKKKGMLSKVLLIAPLRVCYSSWPGELQKWKDFSELRIEILHGPGKDEALARDVDVYIINPEGLDWLFQTQKEVYIDKKGKKRTRIDVDVRRFKKFGFDTLVIDELTLFKNTSSSKFKALKCVHKTFARRWGLTGSPAANGLLDLFGQLYILDEGRSLGQYITKFQRQYFNPHPSGWGWLPVQGADELIFEKIAPVCLRKKAEDYLELPELVERQIVVELSDEARVIYDAFEEDLVIKIEGAGKISAAAASALSLKCRQIASGAVYLDPEEDDLGLFKKAKKGAREFVEVHDAKIEALSELVDELQGSPLLVAYEFQHDLTRLLKKFPNTPYIGSGISASRGKEIEDAWNAGEIPLLFGHPISIARGLNLQEAGNHVAWFTLTWDQELYDQFIRRVYRQGNKSKRVFVHQIIAKHTVDHLVRAVLMQKKKGQDALFSMFGELKKLARSRK